jgi:hypothetical protein
MKVALTLNLLCMLGVVVNAASVVLLSRSEKSSKSSSTTESLELDADLVQTGSEQDGQNGNAEPGQVASLTYLPFQRSNGIRDDANFINYCAGQVLTNGKQVTTGSCNGITMVYPLSNEILIQGTNSRQR